MKSLRQMCEFVGIDSNPLGCGFVITALLRSAAQGEPSTFEGELASLVKASDHFDLKAGKGIREWLTDLGELADMPLPESYWAKIVSADMQCPECGDGDWDEEEGCCSTCGFVRLDEADEEGTP